MSSSYFFRRPDNERPPRQALVVRSVADRSFNGLEQEDQRVEDYHKLQWCVSGSAEIRMHGKRLILQPGEFVHYAPQTEHWARAGKDGWRACWITFYHDIAGDILGAFGLERIGIYPATNCPVTLLKQIKDAASGIDARADQRAGELAYQLLSYAANSIQLKQENDLISRAITLINQRWQDPEFDINVLAAHCQMHRSQLSREFVKRLGIAPSRYVTRLRLQHGARLLIETSHSSAQISAHCGFNDDSYFARCFRKAYGVSPHDYRRQGLY